MSETKHDEALKWLCMECGDPVAPGTETHCGRPTDHEEVCEVCGEPYYVGSDKCLTATRRALAAAHEEIERLRERSAAVADILDAYRAGDQPRLRRATERGAALLRESARG